MPNPVPAPLPEMTDLEWLEAHAPEDAVLIRIHGKDYDFDARALASRLRALLEERDRLRARLDWYDAHEYFLEELGP